MRYFPSTNYSNQVIDGKPSIWLQYYGWAEAKPAGEFKVGEFMLWNTGVSSKVVEIKNETAKMITIVEEFKGPLGNMTYDRKMKKDRWVAIGSEKSFS